MTFDPLPTSVLFNAGNRIQITIAAADADSFQLLPAHGKATYRIGHSAAAPSYVELPRNQVSHSSLRGETQDVQIWVPNVLTSIDLTFTSSQAATRTWTSRQDH